LKERPKRGTRSENNVRHCEAVLNALLAGRPLLQRKSVPDIAPDTIA